MFLKDSNGNAVDDTDGFKNNFNCYRVDGAKTNGLKILPPENYFGDLTGIGITITSSFSGDYVDTSSNLAPITGTVSEDPVDITGDLTGLEFTNSTVDGSDHQVALNNVTFSIADAGAVASADAKIEVKAADGVSAISGVTIDSTAASGVTVTESPTGTWTVTGASTLSDLQTAVQALKVIGPQDYSGDINVTVSASCREWC